MEIVWGVCISYYYSCSSNVHYVFAYFFIDVLILSVSLSYLFFKVQSNLSTTAIYWTEKKGHCDKVAVMGR